MKSQLFLEVLLVLLLTSAALALRVYRLADIPPGLHGDEALNGLDAQKLLRGEWIGIWTPSALGQPTGHVFWVALVLKLSHISAFTVRLSIALLGAASIAMGYLVFRQMFSRRVAVIAALLMVFTPWHLLFSRVGFSVIAMVLVAFLSLFFLFLGFKKEKWYFYVIGGVFLGFGLYTFKSFPFFCIGIGAWLLPQLLFSSSAKERGGILLFGGAAVVAAAPFLAFVLRESDQYFSYFKVYSAFRTQEYQAIQGVGDKIDYFWDRFRDAGLLLHQGVPRDYVDGSGGRALFDRATESFLWLGILISLLRIRQRFYQLILISLLANLMPAVFTVQGELRRTIGMMPFVMLAIALGLDFSLRAFGWLITTLRDFSWRPTVFDRVKQPLVYVGVSGFLAFFSFTSVNYYFKDLAFSPSFKWVYVHDLVRSVDYLKTLDRDTFVYFYSDRWSYNYETRQFLLPDVKGRDRSKEFAREVSLTRDREGKVVYVLLREYSRLNTELQRMYPGGQLTQVKDSDGSVIFAAYYLPR